MNPEDEAIVDKVSYEMMREEYSELYSDFPGQWQAWLDLDWGFHYRQYRKRAQRAIKAVLKVQQELASGKANEDV